MSGTQPWGREGSLGEERASDPIGAEGGPCRGPSCPCQLPCGPLWQAERAAAMPRSARCPVAPASPAPHANKGLHHFRVSARQMPTASRWARSG